MRYNEINENNNLDLVSEIRNFLESHANISPNYDPDYDDPEDRFTGPDPSELSYAADILERGEKLESVPRSDWGSGCYGDYTDKQAKAWHDEIMKKIKSTILTESTIENTAELNSLLRKINNIPSINFHNGSMNRLHFMADFMTKLQISLFEMDEFLHNYSKLCKFHHIDTPPGATSLDTALTDTLEIVREIINKTHMKNESADVEKTFNIVKNSVEKLKTFLGGVIIDINNELDNNKSLGRYKVYLKAVAIALFNIHDALKNMIEKINEFEATSSI